MSDGAVKIFISYSHKDEALRDSLATHLSNLQWQGIISSWYDRQLVAGMEWDDEIKAELESADIILLLISPDFIASKYCREVEIPMSLQRHEAKQAYVVPVILRPFDWFDAPFSRLQAFPKDAKPVTTWSNQDEAFVSVVRGIRTAAKQMLDYRKQEVEQKQLVRAQYLQKVEELLSDGVISIVGRDTLDELQKTLGLTLEEAKEIEAHAYEPFSRYEESLNRYEQTLNRLIEKNYYPFSEEIEKELENRQRDLGLKPEDAARIAKPILDHAKSDYQARKKDTDRKVARLDHDCPTEINPSQPESSQPSASPKVFPQPTVKPSKTNLEQSTPTTSAASNSPFRNASASVPGLQQSPFTTRPDHLPVSRPFTRRQILKWAVPVGVGIAGVTLGSQLPKDATYSNLEEFLKAEQWKKADEETTVLMLRAVNREKDGMLDEASIQNFPCDVLSKIDRLWLNHSDGKFGFSVQKRIYVENCGGNLDGIRNQEAWKCFAERVGYGNGGSNLEGQLPSLNFGYFPQDWFIYSLAFLTATCKM